MEILAAVLVITAALVLVLYPVLRGEAAEAGAALDEAELDAELRRYLDARRAGTLCRRCLAALPRGSRFCAECGRALPGEQAEREKP